MESATALNNLRDAPEDAEPQQEGAARGRAAEQSPQRDGAARQAPGNGNKRQRPNPRPDLKRGREEGGSEASAGTRPSHTKLNIRNKRQIEMLNQRYPGRLELRAPQGATPTTLRMQAQTAARYEDVLAHVTLTGTGGKGSRQVPLWDQTRVWDPGD